MAAPASRLRRLAERARPRTGITWTDVAAVATLGVVYWASAGAGLRLALVERNITPLWPPSGIALAAMILFGRRLWPGVALAAFLVNLPISTSPAAAAATAVGNTLAPVLAATLLLATGFHPRMDRTRDVVSLVGLAALASMTVSATIGSATLVASEGIPSGVFLAAWSVWWAGDAMGVLVFAPFLFVLATRTAFRLPPRVWAKLAEAVVLFALLAVMSAFAVTATVSMLFLVLPIVGWAAWRFQQSGAAPAVVIVSVAATWAAVGDRGPFVSASVFEKMLMLQSFNATVAFTAFFLGALVEERARAREALERGAADLELRVQRRTAQLSTANERLGREVAERREAEDRLRRSERQLAEAQEVARLGTWEWDLATGEMSWSDEMFRIHQAEPGSFDVTFEKSIELVPPEDRLRIRQQVEAALERRQSDLPDIEYPIVLPDGETRHLYGKARISLGDDGKPLRMLGIVQDVTERRAFERERRIADTLQEALLPSSFSDVDGLEFVARYVPAEVGFAAGGDWYDVVPISPGSVAFVIGDVAGHGLEAASLMGQLRMAVRAYAIEGHAPTAVAARTDELLRELAADQMVTMLYVLLDLDTSEARCVNAGHPPALLIGAGPARYLPVEPGPPMGVGERGRFREVTVRLEPTTTIVLYTDGLIDRRDLAIDEGLRRLLRAADEHRDLEPARLCDRLLAEMVPGEVSDDVALLAVRQLPVSADGFHMRVLAEPPMVSRVRRSLFRWLSSNGVPREIAGEIVLASSEAVTNSIRHAYGPGDGWVEVDASFAGGHVEVDVRDDGRWRPPRGEEGGRGLQVIRACMSEVSIEPGSAGTRVRMRRMAPTQASP